MKKAQKNLPDRVALPATRTSVQRHPPPRQFRSLLDGFVMTTAKVAEKKAMRAQGPFIRIVISGACRTSLSGSSLMTRGDMKIFGPTFRSWEEKCTPDTVLFDMPLTARGWQRLVGRPMEQVTHSVINLLQCENEEAAKAMRRLVAANTAKEQHEHAASLIAHLDNKAPVDDEFIDTVTAWLEDPDQRSVDNLCQTLGLSSRQTERLCKTYFGAPPKKLYRMHRALRAANGLIAARSDDWRHVADLSYFDQSHFIRDFKEFLGCTPTRFRQQATPDLSGLC